MKPLDHPITLRMKTGSLDPVHSEDGANLHQTADMNWEPLSDVRRAGTLNLTIQEEMKALAQASAVMGERNSLRPFGGSVNHGEDVAKTLARGQRTHQIHVYMRKPSPGNRNTWDRSKHMCLDPVKRKEQVMKESSWNQRTRRSRGHITEDGGSETTEREGLDSMD